MASSLLTSSLPSLRTSLSASPTLRIAGSFALLLEHRDVDRLVHALELPTQCIDVATNEEELLLDFLHREALMHQAADVIDLANRGRRVQALGASVFALTAHPHASRQ